MFETHFEKYCYDVFFFAVAKFFCCVTRNFAIHIRGVLEPEEPEEEPDAVELA